MYLPAPYPPGFSSPSQPYACPFPLLWLRVRVLEVSFSSSVTIPTRSATSHASTIVFVGQTYFQRKSFAKYITLPDLRLDFRLLINEHTLVQQSKHLLCNRLCPTRPFRMNHAAQMAAARELRASFSGQSSKSSHCQSGRSGRHSVYDTHAASNYPQPSMGRHAMFRSQSAAGAGIPAPVGIRGSTAQTVPPHRRSVAGQSTEQTIGVARSHGKSGSVAVNSSQATPSYLREPVGHAPEQPSGSQVIPPHLRVPSGSSTQQPADAGGSGGKKPCVESQTGKNQVTGNTQTAGNTAAPGIQAFANSLDELQNSRLVQYIQPAQSTPLTQTATLKDAETAKQIASADGNDNPPVVVQSTGRNIRCSAQYILPPHLRQSACGPAQQFCVADTAGRDQGESTFSSFHTGGTHTNDIFNFQAGNPKAAAEDPQKLRNSQSETYAEPPTSSTFEAINITAPWANSAAQVDRLPDTARSQPIKGHGGLSDSRFSYNARLGQSTARPATLCTAPKIATKTHDNHFGSMNSGVDSPDGQQRHVSKYTALPAAAKEAPVFVSSATQPVMAPSTPRAGLITPEPDKKGDDLNTDVEMLDAGRDPVAGDATKHTYGGVLQSRWAPQAVPDTKASQANVLGYRASLANVIPKFAEANNFQAY